MRADIGSASNTIYAQISKTLAVIVTKRMNNNQNIRIEKFSETDFDTLLSWVKDEKELIQFAGPIFSFPLTKEQLIKHLGSHLDQFVFALTNSLNL